MQSCDNHRTEIFAIGQQLIMGQVLFQTTRENSPAWSLAQRIITADLHTGEVLADKVGHIFLETQRGHAPLLHGPRVIRTTMYDRTWSGLSSRECERKPQLVHVSGVPMSHLWLVSLILVRGFCFWSAFSSSKRDVPSSPDVDIDMSPPPLPQLFEGPSVPQSCNFYSGTCCL